MGKGTGLGEMIKSLVLLINACYVLMGMLATSKWDVSSLRTRIKHFFLYVSYYILEFTMDISYCVHSYCHSHNNSIFILSEGKNCR